MLLATQKAISGSVRRGGGQVDAVKHGIGVHGQLCLVDSKNSSRFPKSVCETSANASVGSFSTSSRTKRPVSSKRST